MRLLVFTQSVDRDDPVLGFFHRWIEELAKRVDHVLVFALKTGVYDLPKNVSVVRLRESPKRARFETAVRTLFLAWKHRSEYDAVFVHMNQEYLLVAGWLWKLLGKRVYLWRNHYAGNLWTDSAAVFCDKVFYTSKSSYTAKYKNAKQMPVGVDLNSFISTEHIERMPRSVLFFGRFDRSKRPDLLIEALGLLKKENVSFTATLAGGPSDPSSTYLSELRERAQSLNLGNQVTFTGQSVPDAEKHRYFRSHQIYVNASRSGMLDKIIFEAIVGGAFPLTSSVDMAELAGTYFVYKDGDASDLAQVLKAAFALSEENRAFEVAGLNTKVVTPHRLEVLADVLVKEMSGTRPD